MFEGGIAPVAPSGDQITAEDPDRSTGPAPPPSWPMTNSPGRPPARPSSRDGSPRRVDLPKRDAGELAGAFGGRLLRTPGAPDPRRRPPRTAQPWTAGDPAPGLPMFGRSGMPPAVRTAGADGSDHRRVPPPSLGFDKVRGFPGRSCAGRGSSRTATGGGRGRRAGPAGSRGCAGSGVEAAWLRSRMQ
jgi:hypothetical protein